MELIDIKKEEYSCLTSGNSIIYCTEKFLELNSRKVDKVRYFAGRESNKNYFAFAVGEKNNQWLMPYSAPFGVPIQCKKNISLTRYFDFANALKKFAEESRINYFEIFMPPLIYDAEYIQKFTAAFLNCGFKIKWQDLNYSLNVDKLKMMQSDSYMHSNARKNLAIALKSGLELVQCTDEDMKKSAYNVIRLNRQSKGYPLRMTLEQVMDTIKIVKNDFFLVRKDGENIAAAMIYYVTDKIAQVIYWGDIPDVGQYKPMNFLAYKLTQFYAEKGIEYLDIGPSTENGVPNFGLCDFKESIGCEVSSKFKLFWENS